MSEYTSRMNRIISSTGLVVLLSSLLIGCASVPAPQTWQEAFGTPKEARIGDTNPQVPKPQSPTGQRNIVEQPMEVVLPDQFVINQMRNNGHTTLNFVVKQNEDNTVDGMAHTWDGKDPSQGVVTGTVVDTTVDLIVTWEGTHRGQYHFDVDLSTGKMKAGGYTKDINFGIILPIESPSIFAQRHSPYPRGSINLNGKFGISQHANGDLALDFKLIHDREKVKNNVSGTVSYSEEENHHMNTYTGNVTGSASDKSADLIVSWGNGLKGEYTWNIDDGGHMVDGKSIDLQTKVAIGLTSYENFAKR